MIFSIYGLGKIGVPLACIFASLGKVIGVDIDKEVVEKINNGVSPIKNEPSVDKLIKKYAKNRRLIATTDLEDAGKKSNVKIIIVPLIVDENKNYDFSNILSVSKAIGKTIKRKDIVIVSTTMPVGSTKNIVGKTIEEISNLKMGKDFYLVHAPERSMSGSVIKDLTVKYPQIIGGVDKKSGKIVKNIYKRINKNGVILTKSCEMAEMVKLVENVYRDINIAYANEIAKLCERFNLDFIELMKIVNTNKPYTNMLKATIGVGGHCIPVYPYFLIKRTNKSSVIKVGREINESIPAHAIQLIKKNYGSLNGKKIVVLGLSYRGNVKEDRFSPTYEIIKLLRDENSEVYVYDPLYTKEEIEEKTNAKFIDMKNVNEADGVIIATDHKEFENLDFGGKIEFVFDGKAILDPNKIVKKKIRYMAIGRMCY